MNPQPSAPIAAMGPFHDSCRSAAARALDAGAIARLRELDPSGERGVVKLILATYETALVKARAELGAQIGDADPKTVFVIAHTLKSSSASVGALDLSGICAEIEAQLRPARGGAPEPTHAGAALDGQIARLTAEADAALVLVRTMLASCLTPSR